LKNGLLFKDQPTKSIIGGMVDILENLLVKDLNKAEKLVALKGVLEDQKIEELKKKLCRYSCIYSKQNSSFYQ